MSLKNEVIEYALGQLGCNIDTPFAKYPEYLAMRHPLNNKWAALLMQVPDRKIGGDTDETVDIMNVKLDPMMVASLRNELGYAPAWHMSKEHWLTVRLDGSVTPDQACALLEMSYDLIGPKAKR